MALTGEERAELSEMRSDVAEVKGDVRSLRSDISALHDKMDSVVGIRSQTQDVTARIRLVEDKVDKRVSEVAQQVEEVRDRKWRDRLAWIYVGVTAALGGGIALFELFRR